MLSALLRQSVQPYLPEFSWPWGWRSAEGFRRKVALDFTVRGYRVKTVESAAELKQVLALRRSVFHYEFARKWISLKSDQDDFDLDADHLAIFDEKAGKVAGVYRLIPSTSSRHFYSATEFDISQLLALPGTKLELSRACINREYRNGIVVSLLWRGIAEYAKLADVDYLFGLSSITTSDVTKIAKIHRYFAGRDLVDTAINAAPRGKYKIAGFEALYARECAAGEAEALASASMTAGEVPSLFKTYIKAGAKICSQPVIDRDFNCADWLTVLNMRAMAASYDRKYMRD